MVQRCYIGVLLIAMASVCYAADQNEPTTFRDYCVKAEPGKSAEFEAFLRDVMLPLQQSRADNGEFLMWLLAKSVVPAGNQAHCDYHIVYAYKGITPETMTSEQTDAALKRANIKMNAADLAAKRDSLARLVGIDYWYGIDAIGEKTEKNHYIRLNFYKVKSDGLIEDWVKLETNYWKPLVDAHLKAGGKGAWNVLALSMPQGTKYPYNAMTVDIFPDWKSMMVGIPMDTLWPKVHTDLGMNDYFSKLDAVRDRYSVEVFQAIELARPKMK